MFQKSSITKIWLIIITFLFLFQPALVSVGMNYIIDAFAIIFILFNCRTIQLGNGFKSLKYLIPFLLYFVFYLGLLTVVNGYHSAYLTNINSVISPIINIVIITIFYSCIKTKYRFTSDMIIELFIWATFIQFICVLLSFVSPSIRNFFLQFSINNGSETIQNVLLRTTNLSKRGYGFAENLFDAFTLNTSLLTIITLVKGINEKKETNNLKAIRYIVLAFCFIFISLVNARTGLLLSIIGIIIVLILQSKYIFKRKNAGYVIFIIVLSIIGISILPEFLPDNTKIWLENGFEDINALLFDRQSTGIFDMLFSSSLPDDLLFGIGGEPYLFGYSRIDMGYFRCIWKFGLIGTIVLICCMVCIVRLLYKSADEKWKSIVFCNFALLMIYFFKLLPFSNYSAMFLVFGFPILLNDHEKSL